MALRHWSTTASGNASVAGINWQEGQAPSTINNSAREEMSQVRDQYQPDQWHWVEVSNTASVASQTTFKLSTNLTADFHASRRVRLTGGSSTVYAHVSSSSYTSETTVTISGATGSLSASMSIAALGPATTNSPVRVLASMIDEDWPADYGTVDAVPGDYDLLSDASDGNKPKRALRNWSLIEDSGALGSVASYTKDSIPATFNWLRISYSIRMAIDGAALTIILRKASGTDITSYRVTALSALDGSVTTSNAGAQSSIVVSATVDNTSGSGLVEGFIIVNNIQSAERKGGWTIAGYSEDSTLQFAGWAQFFQAVDANTITGVKVIPSSGNIAAGRVRVEGA